MKNRNSMFMLKSLNVIYVIFLLPLSFCLNSNSISPEVMHRSSLKIIEEIPHIADSGKFDNIDYCRPERDFFRLIYNEKIDQYTLLFYDRSNHKIITQSVTGGSSDNSLTINKFRLDSIIPYEGYGDVHSIAYCHNQNFLIFSDSGITVFNLKELTFKSKKQHDIFDADFYPIPVNSYNPYPVLNNNKTIISFGGNSQKIGKKHHRDFEMFALFDLRTLEADVLKFTFPEDYFEKGDKLSPDFFSFSTYNGTPYVRYRQDSILYNISNTNYDIISLQGPSISAKSTIDSLLVLNDTTFKSISYGGEFLRQSSAGFWSPLIPFHEGKIYCVLSFLPVHIEKVSANRIYSEYKPSIDIYDKRLEHIERLELPFLTASNDYHIGNNEFIFKGKIQDGKLRPTNGNENYFEIFKVKI